MSDHKKVSVLLAVPWDQEVGGVASVVGNLARHLESRGHRVLFFHPGHPEVLRHKKTKWGFDGVEINLRTPFIPGHMLRSVIAFVMTFPFTLIQVIRLLRAQDIRVVNIHYPGDAFIYFAFCRWLLPIRLVVSIHGSDVLPWNVPRKRLSLALRLLLRAADLIVSPSWGFLKQCNHLLGPSSARQIAIHNGIDLQELQAAASEQSGKAQDPFVLSLASHDEYKALDVLIRAMALLKDRGEGVRLVQAGDGPMRAELESLATALGVNQQIQFIGWQSRASVARLLNECAIVVLPSRTECFPLAIIEALACGKPVVATPVGGVPELVEDGTNGILVEPEDSYGLAAAIRLLLGDADLRERFGSAGRIRASRFQWHDMGEGYTKAYEEILQRGA
jgi:glycogen synthase